ADDARRGQRDALVQREAGGLPVRRGGEEEGGQKQKRQHEREAGHPENLPAKVGTGDCRGWRDHVQGSKKRTNHYHLLPPDATRASLKAGSWRSPSRSGVFFSTNGVEPWRGPRLNALVISPDTDFGRPGSQLTSQGRARSIRRGSRRAAAIGSGMTLAALAF